jgi:hypothetical protein
MARKSKMADLVGEAVGSASSVFPPGSAARTTSARAETVVKETVTVEPQPAFTDRSEVRGEGPSRRLSP